jgi:hypothetical protein
VTISSTVGTQLTIQQVVATAYQLAGVYNTEHQPSVADAAFGRLLLDTICNELAADGVFARAVSFLEQTLTVDTYRYTLATSILDLVGDAAYIAADQTDTTRATGESMLRQITREEWHRLGDHAAVGVPSMFYCHRENDQIQAWLYPIPDEAGTVRFQAQRKLADTYDASATLDLEEYWYQAIIWELAFQLGMSKSMPESKLGFLKSQASSKKTAARGKSNERPAGQIIVAHRTPWSR